MQTYATDVCAIYLVDPNLVIRNDVNSSSFLDHNSQFLFYIPEAFVFLTTGRSSVIWQGSLCNQVLTPADLPFQKGRNLNVGHALTISPITSSLFNLHHSVGEHLLTYLPKQSISFVCITLNISWLANLRPCPTTNATNQLYQPFIFYGCLF